MSKITSSFNSAWKQVLDYCKKSPWKERFEEHCDSYLDLYCEELGLSQQEFTLKVENLEHDLMGQLFGVNIETFIEKEFDNPNDNVAVEYLKRRKWKMSKESAICIEEMKDRSFTIYEVVDTKPGEYLVVKDVLLNTKEVKVFKESGSRMANPFDHLVSKIIQVNGEYFFTGTVFVLGHQFVDSIKMAVKKELKEKKLDFKKFEIVPKELCPVAKGVLGKYTPELFKGAVQYIFNPITVVNASGEEVSVNSLNFIIKDKDRVIEKLDKIKALERQDEDEQCWVFTEPRKGKKPIKGVSINSTDEIFLGDIEIEDNKLLCNTMTRSASDKLLKLLQENLGELVSIAVVEHENLFESKRKSNNNKAQEVDIPDKMQEEIIKEFFDQHLLKSLDEKIPVLNNKTPRQCAKTDPKRVIKWVEMMEENTKEQVTGGNYNIDWIYKELGL